MTAALGGKIEVPTLKGTTVMKVPPGTQPDKVLRLKGLGIPSLKHHTTGDQLFTIKVHIPTKLTAKQRELLMEFAKESGMSMEADGDGDPSAGERTSWAGARCRTTAAAIRLELDGLTVQLAATEPAELSFPAGVGGLETLRLTCQLAAPLADDGEAHRIAVTDQADSEPRGWREVSITAVGLELRESDVPSVSPSALLTSYPEDLLTTPVNVRSGTAVFGPGNGGAGPAALAPTSPGASMAPTADGWFSIAIP